MVFRTSLKTVNPIRRGYLILTEIGVFPLLSQTFPFCISLSHLSEPAAFIPWTLKVIFSPHLPPGLSYFKPCHYIYTPVPSHLLNICPFLVGVCMAAPPACSGWLIPPCTLCHRAGLWDSITGCPMSHCPCGASQGADSSS